MVSHRPDDSGPDDFDPYGEDDDRGSFSRSMFVLGGLFVLVVFGVIVYYAYQKGAEQALMNEPPVIRAGKGPLKVTPDQPGGMEVPHQDKLVYDRVTGRDTQVVEQLLPPPEEPMAKPEAVAPATPAETVQPEATETITLAENAAGASTPAATETSPVLDVPPLSGAVDVPAKPFVPGNNSAGTSGSAGSDSAGPRPIQPSAATPAPAQVEPQPETETAAPSVPAASEPAPAASAQPAAPAPAATATAPAGGAFVVQVASLKSREAATAAFLRLEGAMPDLITGLSPDIEAADLGDRGIYYRMRLAPFGTREEAQALCDQLKSRGQDCLVKAR